VLYQQGRCLGGGVIERVCLTDGQRAGASTHIEAGQPKSEYRPPQGPI